MTRRCTARSVEAGLCTAGLCCCVQGMSVHHLRGVLALLGRVALALGARQRAAGHSRGQVGHQLHHAPVHLSARLAGHHPRGPARIALEHLYSVGQQGELHSMYATVNRPMAPQHSNVQQGAGNSLQLLSWTAKSQMRLQALMCLLSSVAT